MSRLPLTDEGIDRKMRSVRLEFLARFAEETASRALSELEASRWSINMPEFAATITLQVTYRAKQSELTTGERAQAMAETMATILRGSPRVKAIEIQCESVGNIEPLDNDHSLTQLRINP